MNDLRCKHCGGKAGGIFETAYCHARCDKSMPESKRKPKMRESRSGAEDMMPDFGGMGWQGDGCE